MLSGVISLVMSVTGQTTLFISSSLLPPHSSGRVCVWASVLSAVWENPAFVFQYFKALCPVQTNEETEGYAHTAAQVGKQYSCIFCRLNLHNNRLKMLWSTSGGGRKQYSIVLWGFVWKHCIDMHHIKYLYYYVNSSYEFKFLLLEHCTFYDGVRQCQFDKWDEQNKKLQRLIAMYHSTTCYCKCIVIIFSWLVGLKLLHFGLLFCR